MKNEANLYVYAVRTLKDTLVAIVRLLTWTHYLLGHTSGLALNTVDQLLTSYLAFLKK